MTRQRRNLILCVSGDRRTINAGQPLCSLAWDPKRNSLLASDRDGRVTREEYNDYFKRGAPPELRHGDGALSPSELARRFAAMDADGDGNVVLTEALATIH